MMLTRPPCPQLRPFVARLWAHDALEGAQRPGSREHVLPTGGTHLVFRLDGPPLRVFADERDRCGHSVARAVVGGPRSHFYIRDISQPSCSVGALLYPGAAGLLLGAAADTLGERHTPLFDLWGTDANRAWERLAEERSAQRRLGILEALLSERLPRLRGLHPAIAEALPALRMRASVGAVVARSGYSQRHFTALFRREVGIAPKAYSRVLRVRQVLRQAAGPAPWCELALQAGYADQSHFCRDFLEIAGLTPGAYRAAAPAQPHHVALSGSDSFKT